MTVSSGPPARESRHSAASRPPGRGERLARLIPAPARLYPDGIDRFLGVRGGSVPGSGVRAAARPAERSDPPAAREES
jgi:hypothetical protein